VTTHLKPFIYAWQFLTAVPLSRTLHHPAPDVLAGSMLWYPLVGILLGGVVALTDVVLVRWLPREVVAALLIFLLVAMTRGLHQDGLADTLDGLAGGRTVTDRLVIMRDPRLGAIGATGLFLSLIIRYGALVSLPDALRIPVLVCMPAIGRWGMVISAYGAPYARAEGGLASSFLTHLSGRHVFGASAVIVCLMLWCFGTVPALTAVLIGAVFSRLATMLCCHLFGGMTGDTLGATNELVEVSFLVLMPLIMSLP
jgi:adenosylcobinamide-GDP ribazoletransferase